MADVMATRSLGMGPTGKTIGAPTADMAKPGAIQLPAPTATAAKAPPTEKSNRTRKDLQAIVSKRGANDPIGKAALDLISLIDENPAVVEQGTYQEALTRMGRAVSQADAGANPAALAKDMAPSIENAKVTNQKQGQITGSAPAGAGGFDPNDPVQAAISGFTPQLASIPGNMAENIENAYSGTINPAIGQMGQIDRNQKAVHDTQEAEASAGLNTLRDTLGKTQAERTAGIVTANNAQAANLSEFRGRNAEQNAQGAALANQLRDQLNGLNEEDRAGYMKYLQETNPLLAAQVAQGSSDEFVGNQKDVLQQYKDRSSPEITAQERLIGELARRKFENDDKSSRDAQFREMQMRGLNSGGQQIAAQQANRQQLSQDRLLSELGLSANAVGRSERMLGGQATVADSLRNADDKMRNFQDTYAQNDAIRRAGVSLDRAQEGRATTGARGDRNVTSEQESQGALRDKDTRNAADYDAGTETTDKNYDREKYGWDQADDNAGLVWDGTKWVVNTKIGDADVQANAQKETEGQKITSAGQKVDLQNMTEDEKRRIIESILSSTGDSAAVGAAKNN